ncbi:hypothetical protein PIB30_092039, partial [Stylosanthes scabra]|nr:hypothetical protein [Stylosanthes scabra]
IRVEEIIADQIYKHVNKTNLRSKLPFPGLILLLCQEKKVSIPGDTLIPHESGINGELMGRFDEAQAENRKSFGEINTRMNQMDNQLSYLCYTHQIANESMFFPYQNIMRQFREMEHQQIPINLANLNAYRAKEEEMRQERMRYEKVLEEAAAQRAKELNKGKVREEENETDGEETEDEGDEW